jgi:hypothetical protein
MDVGIRLGDVVFTMVAFLFPFWPLVVLAPIVYRGNILAKMLAMWGVMMLARIVIAFSPLPIVDVLIHEPFNTVLFLLVGGAIVLAMLIRGLRRLA